TAQQTCGIGPWLHLRAPVFLFLSSSPNARGWRAKGAVPMVTHGRPGCYRATSRKRPDASLRGCVGDTLARHAVSLRFRVHGGRTLTGVSPRRVYPAAARCMWPGVNVASHAHGYRIPSHPSNASRSSAPRGGRNGGNIGHPIILVKNKIILY